MTEPMREEDIWALSDEPLDGEGLPLGATSITGEGELTWRDEEQGADIRLVHSGADEEGNDVHVTQEFDDGSRVEIIGRAIGNRVVSARDFLVEHRKAEAGAAAATIAIGVSLHSLRRVFRRRNE